MNNGYVKLVFNKKKVDRNLNLPNFNPHILILEEQERDKVGKISDFNSRKEIKVW